MRPTAEVSNSFRSYQSVKQLIDQLSDVERARLKRELILGSVAQHPVHASNSDDYLTRREIEVLALIVDGYTRKEVGGLLNISHNTVSSHVTRVYDKLQVSTIAEATRAAIQIGILSPTQLAVPSTRASRRAELASLSKTLKGSCS